MENTDSLDKDYIKWFEMGYHDQSRKRPLLDFVWGTEGYPIEYKVIYRKGQISAYADGLANKPDFFIER